MILLPFGYLLEWLVLISCVHSLDYFLWRELVEENYYLEVCLVRVEIQEVFFCSDFFFFFLIVFPYHLYFSVGVCLSLAFLAIGFQLADTNTPLVTVIESNGDPCSSYTVSQFIHDS